tara:strand:- start:373 stop:585 length:213 start_codon:yes stop_codon:yes gene_type:complete
MDPIMDKQKRIYDPNYKSFGEFVRVLGGYKFYKKWIKKIMLQAQLRKKDNIGRNDPCYCGSGKKFKKCCM